MIYTFEINLINAIEQVMTKHGGKISDYTIGITDDPERRKKEHDSPEVWETFHAFDDDLARTVESHFLNRGMGW